MCNGKNSDMAACTWEVNTMSQLVINAVFAAACQSLNTSTIYWDSGADRDFKTVFIFCFNSAVRQACASPWHGLSLYSFRHSLKVPLNCSCFVCCFGSNCQLQVSLKHYLKVKISIHIPYLEIKHHVFFPFFQFICHTLS